ncbi:hypothetical protein CDAR_53681 [Caerostris darwini]|uniref:Uncharacterized protein n=1 Tax=Caerostris darwini TaxID=1538125 RepID=A0AAV4VSZ8_9ARAC|nr:hypothetical protein CDAR_53681 [Caerostris darwini]
MLQKLKAILAYSCCSESWKPLWYTSVILYQKLLRQSAPDQQPSWHKEEETDAVQIRSCHGTKFPTGFEVATMSVLNIQLKVVQYLYCGHSYHFLFTIKRVSSLLKVKIKDNSFSYF